MEDDGIGGGVDEKEEVGVFPMSVFKMVNTHGKSRVFQFVAKEAIGFITGITGITETRVSDIYILSQLDMKYSKAFIPQRHQRPCCILRHLH